MPWQMTRVDLLTRMLMCEKPSLLLHVKLLDLPVLALFRQHNRERRRFSGANEVTGEGRTLGVDRLRVDRVAPYTVPNLVQPVADILLRVLQPGVGDGW